MCGIVGFIGQEQAAPILLDGLAHLEYRGYDSAGVAVISAQPASSSRQRRALALMMEKLHSSFHFCVFLIYFKPDFSG